MKKKVLAALMTGTMLISAAACSSAKSASDTVMGHNYEAACTEAGEIDSYVGYETTMPNYNEQGKDFNTEEYNTIKENGFVNVSQAPLSTFAADVDTGSYCNLRRMINGGWDLRNVASSIRTEEMVNYFDYKVEDTDKIFGVQYSIGECPWNPQNKLLILTMQANSEINVPSEGNNFVFLIDTSGSMNSQDKLPLVKESFKLLAGTLTSKDRVSVVTYAGAADTLLEGSNDYNAICKAIDSVSASGGTNGSGGIKAAYKCAEKNFIKNGNNRVIIASDGDMNLGITSQSGLVDLIKENKETGVFLTTLGYGTGNYSDANMESIADAGNGNYFYIDSIDEARKVLIDEAGGTLFTVAKDVKLQVEFNPALVKGYRLIGYENRVMAAEDFANDKKDGGEIGAGHQVTALFEIVPVGSDFDLHEPESKYSQKEEVSGELNGEYCTVNIRYKEPDGNTSTLLTYPVDESSVRSEMSDDQKWCAGVAQVAMLLKDSEYKGTSDYDEVKKMLKSVSTDDFRDEFVYLVSKMKNLD